MSTIGNHSHWPIGPAILAGAVLSAMCISPGSTLAQHDSPTAGTPKAATATQARHTGDNSEKHPGTEEHSRVKRLPAANRST